MDLFDVFPGRLREDFFLGEARLPDPALVLSGLLLLDLLLPDLLLDFAVITA